MQLRETWTTTQHFAYYRVGFIKKGLRSTPLVRNVGPTGLEPTAGARNIEKTHVKIRKNKI